MQGRIQDLIRGGPQIVTGLKLPFWGLSFVEFWCWGLIFGGQGGARAPGAPPWIRPCYVFTVPTVCILCLDIQKSGVIEGNIPWYIEKLTTYPSLRHVIHMNFTFKKEICFRSYIHFPLCKTHLNMLKFTFEINNCFSNVFTEGHAFWTKVLTFILPNIT